MELRGSGVMRLHTVLLDQLLSRTEVSRVVVPATMMEVWIVIKAVKQADDSRDK